MPDKTNQWTSNDKCSCSFDVYVFHLDRVCTDVLLAIDVPVNVSNCRSTKQILAIDWTRAVHVYSMSRINTMNTVEQQAFDFPTNIVLSMFVQVDRSAHFAMPWRSPCKHWYYYSRTISNWWTRTCLVLIDVRTWIYSSNTYEMCKNVRTCSNMFDT
jgi:hypothetical protein